MSRSRPVPQKQEKLAMEKFVARDSESSEEEEASKENQNGRAWLGLGSECTEEQN